ncbi:LURP-one-related/scramblase family protein [Demequina sp. NBRC 110054]|uniref:LURP-one-related/scramblase family protein n=1 Tax=Demequina sp. NBRC 110054 TaxID=1570343 RepID=UPI000A025625|nr:LURP-one-related family protein [Demequina sp. NBRC 110054]
MDVPTAPAGYTRLIMKSRFGAGRDFTVLEPETEAEVYVVDGKIGIRPKADILDASGTIVATARGEMLAFPKRIEISDADGHPLAYLHAKPFSFVKDKIEVTLEGGKSLLMEGNLIEKDYSLKDEHGHVMVQITQKWMAVRDRYTLDVADGFAVPIALALTWSIDRWIERD